MLKEIIEMIEKKGEVLKEGVDVELLDFKKEYERLVINSKWLEEISEIVEIQKENKAYDPNPAVEAMLKRQPSLDEINSMKLLVKYEKILNMSISKILEDNRNQVFRDLLAQVIECLNTAKKNIACGNEPEDYEGDIEFFLECLKKYSIASVGASTEELEKFESLMSSAEQ